MTWFYFMIDYVYAETYELKIKSIMLGKISITERPSNYQIQSRRHAFKI